MPDRPKPPRHQVARDGVADRLRNDKPDSSWVGHATSRDIQQGMRSTNPTTRSYCGAEIACGHYPVSPLEHEGVDAVLQLRRKLCATLTTTSGQDRPAGAGTHAQPETVHLRATTIVRLESSLAHSCISVSPAMHVTTAPVRSGGLQEAGSQLLKNTGLNRSGQTKRAKRPIIHTNLFSFGIDTLWTTKVMVSPSAPSEAAQTSSCNGFYRCTNL